MKRREFVGLAAAAVVSPAFAELRRGRPAFASSVVYAAHPDVSGLKVRKVGKVEIVYKSPHAKPNGLQATREGLWVQDQGAENWVSLVNWSDGKVIREFRPDIQAASGVTVDDNNVMWLSSTYSCMHVSCSAQDGKTIAKYWTPGAGRIYQMAGDPPATRSTLKPAYPVGENGTAAAPAGRVGAAGGTGNAGAAAARGNSGPGWTGAAGLQYGQLPLDAKNGLGGTGAHGIEHRGGLLYFAVPPARTLYVMDPKTWVVQAAWPVAANRPHGVGWEGDSLWVADSNLRAFFRHDIKTGKMVEKIQLSESDPIIHGATVHDGHMWFCDDVGWIARLKL
jgi:sugar lactone lactonase YvrE